MTKLIALMMTVALAGDAAAQCGQFWQEELAEALEAQKQQQADNDAKAKERQKKLEAALAEALSELKYGDRPAAVKAYMAAKGLTVEFRQLLDLSAVQGTVIGLSTKIPAQKRAIAARLAWEVAGLMFADMPDSSEREYMRRSTAARAFYEIGGDPAVAKLPVVTPEGDKDEVLSRELKLWLDNKNQEMALYRIGEATGKKDLMQQLDAEKDAEKRKVLEAANKRFIQFLKDESEWKVNHGPC
jgi:hypothetical protein